MQIGDPVGRLEKDHAVLIVKADINGQAFYIVIGGIGDLADITGRGLVGPVRVFFILQGLRQPVDEFLEGHLFFCLMVRGEQLGKTAGIFFLHPQRKLLAEIIHRRDAVLIPQHPGAVVLGKTLGAGVFRPLALERERVVILLGQIGKVAVPEPVVQDAAKLRLLGRHASAQIALVFRRGQFGKRFGRIFRRQVPAGLERAAQGGDKFLVCFSLVVRFRGGLRGGRRRLLPVQWKRQPAAARQQQDKRHKQRKRGGFFPHKPIPLVDDGSFFILYGFFSLFSTPRRGNCCLCAAANRFG